MMRMDLVQYRDINLFMEVIAMGPFAATKLAQLEEH